jgi:hypothetical protein
LADLRPQPTRADAWIYFTPARDAHDEWPALGCGRPLKPFVKAAAFGNALTAGLMGLAGQYFEAVEADKG